MGNLLSLAAEAVNADKDDQLDLVLFILPKLRQWTRQILRKYPREDYRRQSLQEISTCTLVLEIHLKYLSEEENLDPFRNEISELAACLDTLLKDNDLEPSPYVQTSAGGPQHPNLQFVRNASLINTEAEFDVQNLFEHLASRDKVVWGRLQVTLAGITKRLENYKSEDWEPDDYPIRLSNPHASMSSFVERASTAVSCKHPINFQRDLMLRLGTYREDRGSEAEALCFLLSQTDHILRWREVHVHHQRNVGPPDHSHEAAQCICCYLEAYAVTHDIRIDIELANDILQPYMGEPKQRLFDLQDARAVDLGSLLSEHDKRWTVQARWTLAIIVAYGLLYLYEMLKDKGVWTQENIVFFNHRGSIPLRPFFKISADPPENKPIKTQPILHGCPEILNLGIILLELEIGRSVDDFHNDGIKSGSSNDAYLRAWDAFKKIEMNIESIPYRMVLKACLTRTTFASVGDDVAGWREIFFHNIIQPLETEITRSLRPFINTGVMDEPAAQYHDLSTPSLYADTKAGWHDRIASNVTVLSNSENSKRNAAKDSSLHAMRAMSQMQGSKTVSGSWESPRSHITGQNQREAHVHGTIAMLSDARPFSGDHRATVSEYGRWARDFRTFRDTVLPYGFDADNQQKVRVTIIDTGIDALHPYLNKRWVSRVEGVHAPLFCDWTVNTDITPSDHDPVDADGHGTFIAGLLLQLAPNIELSVARIGVTRQSIKNDVQLGKRVGKAIEYAIDVWNTEIISISFGSQAVVTEIRDAIEKAHASNVIVVAAAGNSGNCDDIAFPASEDGVIKAFAANSMGKAAGFSPSPQPDESSYFILGCGVLSTWPSQLQEKAKIDGIYIASFDKDDNHEGHTGAEHDLWAVMSGASFATPITAALVAIIFEFYDNNKDIIHLRGGARRFKTQRAVRAILSALSRPPAALTPYYFLTPSAWIQQYPHYCGVSETEWFAQKLTEALSKNRV